MLFGTSFRSIVVGGLFGAATLSGPAQPLYVPNASFESPATAFVENRLERWQKTPKPFWYDESGGFTWDQLFGVFRNSEPGKDDHLGNAEGNQAIYLFAVPEAGIFQDAVGNGRIFTVGKAYTLTTAVLGGGGGMTNGASLEMSLYYLDAAGQRVVVGATNIVHDPARFPSRTNFVDIRLHLPTVQPGEVWAGRPIGIRFLSTVDPARAGGYWDLDAVRLVESIELPNASFESPATTFVDNRVDFWEKTPKPFWYDESGGFTWDQLTGVFRNTEPGKDDHLENVDGNQGFYLFAVPEVGILLDENSAQSSSPTAARPSLARFESGQAYTLTAAVQGNGGGMTNGATLELSLYYRDTAGVPVTVASTLVTNDAALFPTRHLFSEFQVRTAPVRATDAWIGRNIGVRVLSTVDPARAGGYWNVDHFRLEASPEPKLLEAVSLAGRFGFVLQSEAGQRFEVLSANSATAERSAWAVVATLTNATGFVAFSETAPGNGERYYRVQQLP